MQLPNGAPRNGCERADWFELVPSRVEGSGVTPHYGSRFHSHQITTHLYEGYGLYRPGQDDPEDLEDVWPRLKEPELQKKHVVIIDRVEREGRTSLFWSLGGLGGMVAGFGTAAAIQDETKTGAAIAGVSGLAIGVVGIVMSLVNFPSARDQADAEAREKILLPEEDDMTAVERGTNRANGERRRACGGTPAPYVPRPVAPAPPPVVNVAPPQEVWPGKAPPAEAPPELDRPEIPSAPAPRTPAP